MSEDEHMDDDKVTETQLAILGTERVLEDNQRKIMQKNRIADKRLNIKKEKISLNFKKEAKEFFSMVDNSMAKNPLFIKEYSDYNFPLKLSTPPELVREVQ